jgi:hypothetical protein
MERALTILEGAENINPLEDEERSSKTKFTDSLWGDKARSWVNTTKRLDADDHWPLILEEASQLVELPGVGNEDEMTNDPRGAIEFW